MLFYFKYEYSNNFKFKNIFKLSKVNLIAS